jgi:hypothetical protein
MRWSTGSGIGHVAGIHHRDDTASAVESASVYCVFAAVLDVASRTRVRRDPQNPCWHEYGAVTS